MSGAAPMWPVVAFTLQVAATATALILIPGLALAWVLARGPGARRGFSGRVLLETLVSLPLVLPPTAVGLGLLLLFSREGPLGIWLHRLFGWELVFTRAAVVLACSVMALPLLVRSARSALEEVDPRLVAVARTLGRSPLAAFLEVHLPLAWRGVLAGVVLAFTRALGEFGATILVAGNIPGRTQTLALALFQEIQMGRDAAALRLAGVSALIAFGLLLVTELLVGSRQRSLEEG